jgi:hypothetical protein
MRFLSTTSPLNVEYRVRDALFEFRGPEDLDIYSEDHLADPIVNELLASGTHTATLQSGWRIEYSTDGKPMPASPPPTPWWLASSPIRSPL